jgi:protein-tyrosine phosphatase
LTPNLLKDLRSGTIPRLGSSRYFLLEPPQDILPPRFGEYLFGLVSAGYVPIITHPERSVWIESQYTIMSSLVRSGVWLQITAGSILGKFGRAARRWSMRLLEDGLVHVIASDAHDVVARPPRMREALDQVEAWLGRSEAVHMVVTRPAGILRNIGPRDLPAPVARDKAVERARKA